ncbi:acetoin utilization AcuB family protein [Salisediminibacterium halotolerans]|uniref:Acetoin utilization protein AcuB n=1 Tax=Salisediminibacterium halotolerans TaxID=517425 RepID=A0A1H9V811_9BACI|nr:acetoin utilization AcuB family protein [Salisediminibacterium haloalkalitolerans]SES17544.1 acetoin utilization protein AcuB [Salisediminibacterium haloalkalitolerans]
MNVSDIMIRNIFTAEPDMAIGDALELMKKKHFRHMPVTDSSGTMIGIISDRDLKEASPSIFEGNHKDYMNRPISDVMVTNVITALPMDFAEDAANMMVENDLSCLPVENEEGDLVGIITETDLLKTFVKLTGAANPSSRLEVEVPNESGMLCDVSVLIKEHRMNVQSVLLYPSSEKPDCKILVFRLSTMDMRPLIETLKKQGYNVIWPRELGITL